MKNVIDAIEQAIKENEKNNEKLKQALAVLQPNAYNKSRTAELHKELTELFNKVDRGITTPEIYERLGVIFALDKQRIFMRLNWLKNKGLIESWKTPSKICLWTKTSKFK